MVKVLYAGTLDPFGTCFSRLTALKKLNTDIIEFDTDDYLRTPKVNRLEMTLEGNIQIGRRLKAANNALIQKVKTTKPDILWLDAAEWIRPKTLKAIKEQGVFLAHHVTDALKASNIRTRLRRRYFTQTVTQFDAFLTTNLDDYNALVADNYKGAILTHLGYDSDRFTNTPLPAALATEWEDGIVFVGHYEKHTEEAAIALHEAGLPVTIYGHTPWHKSPNRHRLGDRLKTRLGNEEYTWALKAAKIGLCLVSKLNYNQTASRSFEVPGSGTMLLAIRTPQHMEAYIEGQEAEFFDSHKELIEKARYYLENDVEREAIAQRGYERCHKSGYSWNALMARDWKIVEARFKQYNSEKV